MLNKLTKKNKNNEEIEDSNDLSSVSDLMSGLMIVFLLIAVSFMVQIEEESDNAIETSSAVKSMVDEYEKRKKDIYDDLVVAFQDKANEWNMKIDEKDGTIRFEEPEVLFAQGESTISPKFEEILNDFFPKYIETIYGKHKDSIKEIRIEGHTSSVWAYGVEKSDAYFRNMELSQDRTRSVLNYSMSIPAVKGYEDWLIKNVTANGMSSSRPILNSDGIENEEESRRVEFKIITNAEDVIGDILEKALKNDI